MDQEQEQKDVEVPPVVKLTVFVGIFLLRILSGIPWIWGNLVAYVTSYYYVKGDNSSGDWTNWVMSVEMLSFNAAMLLGKSVTRKIGLRTTLLLGILVYNSGIVLTFFTVRYSVFTLCATFGILTGFFGGLVEAVQLILIVKWTEKYHGLSTSSVQSSVILGAVLVNLLLTWFINSENVEANYVINNKSIFTQQDVIDRVPPAFLLYGTLSLVLNVLGFFLVRTSPGQKCLITEIINRCLSMRQSSGERVSLIVSEEKVIVSDFTTVAPTASALPVLYNNHNYDDDTQLYQQTENSHENHEDTITATKSYIIRNSSISPNDHNEEMVISDLTPRDVFKTRSFYTLLVFKVVQFYAFFILNNYYKTFGLLYIPDDHFLTAIVMVKCLVTPVCTWVVGFILDKFGVKPTLIVVSSIFCILSSFFYLTTVDKWLYFTACVLGGCSLFTLFCLNGACCVKLYGETHFTTIFGMTFIPGYVIIPLLPLITEWIISSFGWFVLFISMAFLALINVFTLVWGMPEKTYRC